ncbi:MAG: polyprenyl synthetase family protein [Caldisericia bacterium]|nr:polyprenyl synthetase family protein [Caldisericia bacterium]
MINSLEQSFINKKNKIDSKLMEFIVPIKANSVLFAAIDHSIFSGGKRIRPVLLLCTFEALSSSSNEAALYAGCALEMLHCYSLVHDDLPCLDNDEFRRGKKTTHTIYGADIGLLTGDALLTEAMHTLSIIPKDMLDSSSTLELIRIITEKGGLYGMIEGQALECLQKDPSTISKNTSITIMTNKTAALFSAAFMMGAICAKQTPDVVSLFERIGICFGQAFQLADDYKDRKNVNEKANAFQLFDPVELISMFNSNISEAKAMLSKIGLTQNSILDFVFDWLEKQIPNNEL